MTLSSKIKKNIKINNFIYVTKKLKNYFNRKIIFIDF